MAVRVQLTGRAGARQAGPEGADVTATVIDESRLLEAADAVLGEIDAALG